MIYSYMGSELEIRSTMFSAKLNYYFSGSFCFCLGCFSFLMFFLLPFLELLVGIIKCIQQFLDYSCLLEMGIKSKWRMWLACLRRNKIIGFFKI